ncbi:MAG TPA: type II toxin-antitoxin system VapC family toxin [Candidatus Nanoarchaeia archaeon]|nr:type II toxin-antitoxin system VapC family toxin [Candidatus Nanoarchaeia archaeon]
MYLLDTDILVGFLRNDALAVSKMQVFLKEKGIGFISAINIHELVRGACLSKNTEKNLEKTYALIQSLNFIPFDMEGAFLSGKLSAEQEKSGRILGQNDVFIAALALQYKLVLITRNKRHFEEINGLKVEGW